MGSIKTNYKVWKHMVGKNEQAPTNSTPTTAGCYLKSTVLSPGNINIRGHTLSSKLFMAQ